MNTHQKYTLGRILISLIALIVAYLLPTEGFIRLISFLIPYLLVGYDVLWSACRNIVHGQIFDENFLMSIATIGAFVIGEYAEAVFVMLFYQTGELFQNIAVSKSRKAISALMDICPDTAFVERDGSLVEMLPEEVMVGSIILVKPGERIPLDGEVIQGESSVNTSALTGESIPCNVAKDDPVYSGSICLDGMLRIRVTKEHSESTASRILALVEESASKKAQSEQFITRFSRFYTPIVVGCAALLAIIPPLFFNAAWDEWLHRSLLFLVVSCPCALVISVPLTYFGGIGGASKLGILAKGSNCFDVLSKVDTVIFDKTGTLTSGHFSVSGINPIGISEKELLYLAAHAEAYSAHPLARALRDSYGAINSDAVTDVREYAGKGVEACVDEKYVKVGNASYTEGSAVAATAVHVSVDGKYCGYIEFLDTIRPDAKAAIDRLRSCGVERIVILTGDRAEIAAPLGKMLCADEVISGLLPEGKVKEAERIIEAANGKVAYVGDGINDAPVLMRADVGIAMGALGSDAAIEAADIVLMNDSIERLPYAMILAKKVRRIVIENIAFALIVKLAVLVMGAVGIATMWEAVFADVGVSVIAILNATRALRRIVLK